MRRETELSELPSQSRTSISEESDGQVLYFEKVSRFFSISPIIFGVIIFGISSIGNEFITCLTLKSFGILRICNALAWWMAYSSGVAFLLYLKTKYIKIIKSIDLPEGEHRRLIDSFPNKRLRISLILFWTLFFMVLQIAFYVFVLRVPFYIVSPLGFIFWEAFLPFCGIVAGEWFAEVMEIGVLPWRIRKKVRIDVLHYDHHGGLKVVSELFTGLIITMTGYVVLITISTFTSMLVGMSGEIASFWLLSSAILGTLGIISAFIIPQLFLSKKMKESKDKELTKYHQNLVPTKPSGNYKEALIHLHNVTLYQEIQKMHEHPFSIGQLEKAIAVAIIPTIETAIPFLLSYV